MISGGQTPGVAAAAPAGAPAPAVQNPDPKPSPISAVAQSKIAQLAQEKCVDDSACRAKLNALVEGVHKVCDNEPANALNAYRQTCLLKQLTNPSAMPRRVFPFENRAGTFLEHYAALQGPQTGGQSGANSGAAPGGSAPGGPADGAVAGGGAAGDLAVDVAKYNSDGLRELPSFLREATGTTDYLPHGSVTASVEPSSETFGFLTAAEAEGKIVNDPDYSVGYGAAAMLWQWPNLNALYSGDSALRKGWYPKGTEDPDGLWSDFQLYVYFEKPLGGRYGIALPAVNLVSANEKALEIEEKCEKRWGKEAAAVYLDSVLRKQMAHATGDTQDFSGRWNAAVTIGAKKYEEMLSAASLPKGGAEADALATQIQLADLFQYDPMGLVDFIAVWSGKTSEEVKEKLANVDWNAIHSNKGADRVANVRSILTAANAVGLSKEYKFSDKYEEEGKPEETPLPDSFDIRSNYKRKMNEVLGQIAKASNMKEEDLRKEAKEKKLDLDGPPNPWAAQRVVGELIDSVAKKKYGDKAPVTLRVDLGNVDRNHDYPGFGAKLRVTWNPFEVLELGGWVFAGAARSNPIDTTSDGPSFAFVDVADKSDDGWTMAGGLSVNGTIFKSTHRFVRELSLKGSAYYTGAGDEGTPSGNSRVGWLIGPSTTLAPFSGVNFRTTHGFHYEGRWKMSSSGDVIRHFIVASPLALRFGDHFYLKPADYTYQNGTRGGGDFANDLTTNNPWGGPATGTTPPASTERTLDLGQTGHFLKGVVGWEFEAGRFIEAGYSLLVYNDLVKINDERISNGSLDRFTVYLGVGVPF